MSTQPIPMSWKAVHVWQTKWTECDLFPYLETLENLWFLNTVSTMILHNIISCIADNFKMTFVNRNVNQDIYYTVVHTMDHTGEDNVLESKGRNLCQEQPRTLHNTYQKGQTVLLTWVFIPCQYLKRRNKMIMMTLEPVALMPNALSTLKVMKKFIQKSEVRKLIDRNIIKDR